MPLFLIISLCSSYMSLLLMMLCLIICVFVDYFSLLNDALTVLVSVNSVYGLKASINYVLLLCFLSSCFHVCSVNDA